MAYIPKELAEGERLITLSRPSWWLIAPRSVLALAVYAVGFVIVKLTSVFSLVTYVQFALPVLVVIWLAMVANPLIRVLSTEIAITDRRVTSKTGIFTITVKTTPLDKVNNCDVRQTLFGRMLGYGDLEVTTATAEEADNHFVRALAHPNEFRNTLTALVDKEQ